MEANTRTPVAAQASASSRRDTQERSQRRGPETDPELSGQRGKRKRDHRSRRPEKRKKSEPESQNAHAGVAQSSRPAALLEEKVPGNQNDLVPSLIRVRSKTKAVPFKRFVEELVQKEREEPAQDANLGSRKQFVIVSSRMLRKTSIELPGFVEPYKEADFIREGKELNITECNARGFKMFEALCHTMERLIVDEVSLRGLAEYKEGAPKRVVGVPYFKVVLYTQIILKNFTLLGKDHLVSKRILYLPLWLRRAFEEARKRGYTNIKVETRQVEPGWITAYMTGVTFGTEEQGWEKYHLMKECSWVKNKQGTKPKRPRDLGFACVTERCLHWAPKKEFHKKIGQTEKKIRFGPDVLSRIASYLDKQNLDQFRQVCRDWHRAVRYVRCYLRTEDDVDALIAEIGRSRGLKGIRLWINYRILAAGMDNLWKAINKSGIVVVKMSCQEIAYRIARHILSPKVIYERDLWLDLEEVRRVKENQIAMEEYKQRILIEMGINAVLGMYDQLNRERAQQLAQQRRQRQREANVVNETTKKEAVKKTK